MTKFGWRFREYKQENASNLLLEVSVVISTNKIINQKSTQMQILILMFIFLYRIGRTRDGCLELLEDRYPYVFTKTVFIPANTKGK